MTPSNYLIGFIIKYMHFTPKFHCFSLHLLCDLLLVVFLCHFSTKNICSIILSASSCKGLSGYDQDEGP